MSGNFVGWMGLKVTGSFVSYAGVEITGGEMAGERFGISGEGESFGNYLNFIVWCIVLYKDLVVF